MQKRSKRLCLALAVLLSVSMVRTPSRQFQQRHTAPASSQ